jgi:hypothetical protein
MEPKKILKDNFVNSFYPLPLLYKITSAFSSLKQLCLFFTRAPLSLLHNSTSASSSQEHLCLFFTRAPWPFVTTTKTLCSPRHKPLPPLHKSTHRPLSLCPLLHRRTLASSSQELLGLLYVT